MILLLLELLGQLSQLVIQLGLVYLILGQLLKLGLGQSQLIQLELVQLIWLLIQLSKPHYFLRKSVHLLFNPD